MQSELHPFAIGGVPVTDLVETHGTPLYVYDGQKIVSQLQTLQRAFSGVTLRLKYAAKALTNLSVLKLLRGAGADLDVVSIEEAQLGLLAGYRPGQILYTPSGVSFDEIVQAVEMGLEINIDSLSMLEKLGRKYGASVPCCLRLNPHIVAGGNAKIQVGHIQSKFGISIDYIDAIHRLVNQYQININGLHIHTGSDIKDPGVFMQSANILFEPPCASPTAVHQLRGRLQGGLPARRVRGRRGGPGPRTGAGLPGLLRPVRPRPRNVV
jgi:diaminopimelate decarboxylase